MQRVTSYLPAGTPSSHPIAQVKLPHDLRHLRRKLLHLENGEMVMLDLKDPVLFANGDLLVRDDGELIEILAADEKLFEIRVATAPIWSSSPGISATGILPRRSRKTASSSSAIMSSAPCCRASAPSSSRLTSRSSRRAAPIIPQAGTRMGMITITIMTTGMTTHMIIITAMTMITNMATSMSMSTATIAVMIMTTSTTEP